jgi:hypothetical protein
VPGHGGSRLREAGLRNLARERPEAQLVDGEFGAVVERVLDIPIGQG